MIVNRSSMTARPGARSRLVVNALGTAVSGAPGPYPTQFNFTPRLSGTKLRLSYGAVDGEEPRIKGELMSETFLELTRAEVDDQGRSWACLEVEAGADGLITAFSRIAIVHTKDKNFFTPEIGRSPVALILWKGNAPVRVEHLLKFCCHYQRVQESATFRRHLFL